MLNTYYSKLLKLLSVVLLAIVFTIGFTKNVSYAVTREEWVDFITEKVTDITSPNLKNNITKMLNTTDWTTVDNIWKTNNAVVCWFTNNWETNTYKDVYFIFFNDSNYSYYAGINNLYFPKHNFTIYHLNFRPGTWQWSTGQNMTQNQNSIQINNFKNLSTSLGFFVSDEKYVYTDNNYNVVANYYFNELLRNGPTFEKQQSLLNYSNNYILLGKLKGEDIYQWRTRAILYQNNSIVASYNEIGLGGNVENGMITRKIDNDIYIYVRTSLIYPNKVYDLDVYYDEDSNTLEFNEHYTFVLGSGDSGYTSQNSTNDIIENQNQNTDNIINAIESGNNNVNDFLTSPLNLSGENISSGDIVGALDMNFSGDPYQNVWVTLIDGLRNCLVGVDREFDIDINNHTYTISLDSFSPKLPAPLKTFLTLVSTTFMLWVLLRWIKLSIDKVQTANVDNLLQQNEEERHN